MATVTPSGEDADERDPLARGLLNGTLLARPTSVQTLRPVGFVHYEKEGRLVAREDARALSW